MLKDHSEIIEFYKRRTGAHITALNYFAGLLGTRFPEHDSDKFSAPLLIPYALKNYSDYHPDFAWSDALEKESQCAWYKHHSSAAHHVESYADIADMPDTRITEMLCDWFTANNEQNLVQKRPVYCTIMDFYSRHALPTFKFVPRQQTLILELIEELKVREDTEKFLEIWKDIK